MTVLFHENDCNFLCTVIMTEYSSLFKRTAGTVAECISVDVTASIYCIHTNMHTKHVFFLLFCHSDKGEFYANVPHGFIPT